jgi:hypothetical protein
LNLLCLTLQLGDSECVVIHDNAWCNVISDSESSDIIKQYTDFFFNDAVDLTLVNCFTLIVLFVELIRGRRRPQVRNNPPFPARIICTQ